MATRARKAKTAASPSRSLQDSIRLRYRADGHLRFQIPPALCEPAMAAALEAGLLDVEGVYRVIVYRRSGKLSVRYLEEVCAFSTVVLAFERVLDRLVEHPPGAAPPLTWKQRLHRWNPVRRAGARVRVWRDKAQMAADVLTAKAGLPVTVNIDLERNAINFLNDLVAFYLIKAHWTQITQQWMRQPIKYRYAWLSMIYLVFLMVRYRKARSRKITDKTQA